MRRLGGVGVDYWDGFGGAFWGHDRLGGGEESMIILAVEFRWGGWLRRANEIGWMGREGGGVYASSGG